MEYKWHNLKENPNDLPNNGDRVLFRLTDDFVKTHFPEEQYYTGTFGEHYNEFWNDDDECYITQGCYKKDIVSHWCYIEEIEEVE